MYSWRVTIKPFLVEAGDGDEATAKATDLLDSSIEIDDIECIGPSEEYG